MGLDSVELVMAIEKEFGIEIPDSDAGSMYTVGDVYEWLKVRVATSNRDTDEEVWNRLVQVFVRQTNARPDEIRPEASITRDLGVD